LTLYSDFRSTPGRDMTTADLIHSYGYIGVLIGTFLEGETTLILAAFAAHQGYLELPYVMLAASVGSLCGDQSFFWLGRKRREKTLEKHPSLRARVAKAQALTERHRTLLMFAFRFMYGLRTVIPFAFGMSRVPVAKFLSLSATSSVVWAILVGGVGFLFGDALEGIMGNIERYELFVLAAIAAIGAAVWTIYLCRRKKKNPSFFSENRH
jgi:membrane protein DedA with SNARE-associated domain